jgi:hypothetical protein
MGLLDMTPVGTALGNANITIGGFVEMGWFYDASRTNRAAGSIPARTAGDLIGFAGAYPDSVLLDQLDLNIARSVDPTAGKFDVGFNFDGFFGTDAWYTHSNGMFDTKSRNTGGTGFVGGPEGQWDIDVANVVVTVPLKGLELMVGKFDTLLGYEVINPTGNPFYTHSYSFNYGVPLTQSGVMATYTVNSALTVEGGATMGWNQGPDDHNGSVDLLAEAVYVCSDKLTFINNTSFGPENSGDSRDYQFVEEIIPKLVVSDQLNVAADILYAYDNAISQWYGVCLYAGYKVNPMFTVNARAEFYHDGKGHTTGISGLMGSNNTPIGGRDTNYFEVTTGVSITPMPDNQWLSGLTIRPEVRIDFADRGVFDGSSSFDTPEGNATQLTCAIDAYYKF